MTNNFEINQEQEKLILKQRTLTFAKPQLSDQSHVDAIRTVVLSFEQEKYGIEVDYVREIFPLGQLTDIPCTPDFISGIINVRGNIISIIDLRKFFGIPCKGITDLKKVVIISHHNFEMGILAAEVSDVMSIQKDQLFPGHTFFTNIDSDYIKGITKEMLVLLDIKNLINDKKLIIDDEII